MIGRTPIAKSARSSGLAGQLWFSIILIASIAGCVTLPREPEDDLAPAARQAKLHGVEVFDVSGKLGIWSEDQALSSRFFWNQSGNVTRVRLSAPLGLGQWQLNESPEGGATLQRGSEPAWHDASLDALVQRALALDTPVPVSQLRFWMKGEVGDNEAARFDELGRLESLRHATPAGGRWQMSVLAYTAVDGLELPELIVAKGSVERSDGVIEAYRLRLVLDEWRTSDSTVAPTERSSVEDGRKPSGSERLRIPGR